MVELLVLLFPHWDVLVKLVLWMVVSSFCWMLWSMGWLVCVDDGVIERGAKMSVVCVEVSELKLDQFSGGVLGM